MENLALNFTLYYFGQDLYNRIKDLVYNNDNGEHTEEVNEGVTSDLFNMTYYICYMSAINRSITDLHELYKKKGILIPVNSLLEIKSQCRTDISKMKAILHLTLESLMECGFSFDQALEFITNYRVGKYAC